MLLTTLSFACDCSGDIDDSFSDYTDHIEEKLESQSQSLSVLTDSIKENIQNLKSQNSLLNQELVLLKKEALQSKELIFLLKQRN